MTVGLDVDAVRVALQDVVRPEVAVGRRVVDDDDAFARLLAAHTRRSNFTTPPTTVATGRAVRVSPMNGEFEALERKVFVTCQRASASISVTSPRAPGRSVPPSRLNVRAGPQEKRSTRRSRSITFAPTRCL